ncbi:MAG TPA: S8 family serine peptidase [Cyclobacteriaceae bacterium]|nr:S8 family serine peptidase [Cyclobacteriaceae bacterium]
MKIFSNIVLLLLLAGRLYAADHYWIYFDKKNTAEANANCETSGLSKIAFSDIPVDQNYLNTLAALGICIKSSSKWLNAAYAELDDDQLPLLAQLPMVSRIELAGYLLMHDVEANAKRKLNKPLSQIKGEAMVKAGLNGTGVKIGVVDAGFKNLDKDATLAHLLSQNQIKAFKDYINPANKNPFDASASGMVDHGTKVLRLIAGKHKKNQFGLATNADFYLAYTDHDATEKRVEEAYWIAALEWFDSLGVKLVNSSLGYADGYDDPSENYLPAAVDGKSTAITRAAQIAATEKGMLIVVSAGNDGNRAFRILSLPADAQDVLAVGANTQQSLMRARYSSIGPAWLSYAKPDVVCYSPNGTSFSAPVITGLAACMMEYSPQLSNMEIMDMIKQSASIYPYANNFIGYGVPDASKIMNMFLGQLPEPCLQIRFSEITEAEKTIYTGKKYMLFHKSDHQQVRTQMLMLNKGSKRMLRLNPPADEIKRSTLANWQYCYEILWNE